MLHLEQKIDEYLKNGIPEHIAVRVGMGDQILYDTYRGGVDAHTLFDMASVTKIMATTPLALIALERGLLHIDDPVSRFYNTDQNFTVGHLLTHTTGIGHVRLNAAGNTYDNIAEWILKIQVE